MLLEDLERNFIAFLDEAHRLKKLYAPQITLLVGAETEYITGLDLDRLHSMLERHGGRIELLVGSVHHVNTIPIDFDQPTFDRALRSCSSNDDEKDVNSFLEQYFDSQYTLLTRFQPEVIGHLDLCRLYTPTLEITSFPGAWSKLERNVKYACGYGALFEFNSAAFRKGWDCAYPGRDVVNVCMILNEYVQAAHAMFLSDRIS